MVRVGSQYFPVLDCIPYSYARKKDVLALPRVTVSRQYFPVFGLYIVQYAERRTSWLSIGLGLAIQYFQFGIVALVMVRVGSQYFPVLDCIPYSYARRMSWLSLWLR